MSDTVSDDRAVEHLEQMAHGAVRATDHIGVRLDDAFDGLGRDPCILELATHLRRQPRDSHPAVAAGQSRHRVEESRVDVCRHVGHEFTVADQPAQSVTDDAVSGRARRPKGSVHKPLGDDSSD